MALECDIELGGTDQKFNLLVGRELQRDYGQKPQIVATVPLLEGLDGVEKMAKSKGNYVGIQEPAHVMMKKLMTISDTLMWRYFELLTDLSVDQIAALRTEVTSGRNPRDVKLDLAERIISGFHSADSAASARQQWLHDVSEGQIPADLDRITATDARLNRMLVQASLAGSVSEADRLIKAGAVALAPAPAAALEQAINPTERLAPGEYVVRAGKRYKLIAV